MPDIVVMFFILGLVGGLVKSDLAIPKAAYDVLSLLLMLTIGLKGGMALHGNMGWGLLPELLSVALLGFLIPLILFPLLLKIVRLPLADSASFAAHYGSVSAGTFAVALAYAESHQMVVGGQVTLYLVLLELPAIVIGLMLYRQFSGLKQTSSGGIFSILHESLTNRGVILLIGGVIIGWMYGPRQGAGVTDLYMGAFMGVLALFLLEMGLVAAEALSNMSREKIPVVLFAVIAPSILALVGLFTGKLLGLPEGSILILASLTASASYIAAPVAVRAAIPQADIGLAMLASLGLTFPFNVLVGIPLYHSLIG
ncbi:sodium-dependent bicarbonate transport family permease [Methylophaga pinxianii]|uniref:sodium-dependent bicarbonate transport family permease n=1 Tax=Methylophaga pinxianii TaxID=2881052 RepID=UPI001CF3D442|nr:sodium-dependent bicarbonate transport family permease [Methylophaga pinxianii]MCB2426334.1 sodium-dependent bicarbonate transport family permease [Methylophaga pinxianii]UPH46831.1 sodium-dependent bicarbonate transport family permease [Methylophaga pinxianii]